MSSYISDFVKLTEVLADINRGDRLESCSLQKYSVLDVHLKQECPGPGGPLSCRFYRFLSSNTPDLNEW